MFTRVISMRVDGVSVGFSSAHSLKLFIAKGPIVGRRCRFQTRLFSNRVTSAGIEYIKVVCIKLFLRQGLDVMSVAISLPSYLSHYTLDFTKASVASWNSLLR